jgi:hypothetical protein
MKFLNGDSGVWRWLAIFLAGVVIAAVPAMVRVLTLPTRSDYARLDERSSANQLQIVRLQEQLLSQVATNSAQIVALKEVIMEIKDALERIEGP